MIAKELRFQLKMAQLAVDRRNTKHSLVDSNASRSVRFERQALVELGLQPGAISAVLPTTLADWHGFDQLVFRSAVASKLSPYDVDLPDVLFAGSVHPDGAGWQCWLGSYGQPPGEVLIKPLTLQPVSTGQWRFEDESGDPARKKAGWQTEALASALVLKAERVSNQVALAYFKTYKPVGRAKVTLSSQLELVGNEPSLVLDGKWEQQSQQLVVEVLDIAQDVLARASGSDLYLHIELEDCASETERRNWFKMLFAAVRRSPALALAGLAGVLLLAIWVEWHPRRVSHAFETSASRQACAPQATVTVTAAASGSASSSLIPPPLPPSGVKPVKQHAWQPGPTQVIETDAGSTAAIKRSKYPVCAFRNLCIRDPGRNPSGYDPVLKTQFMLLGTARDQKHNAAAAAVLADCFKLAQAAEFGVVSDYDPARLRWINGTTYLAQKNEKGRHPAAWGRAWAILLSNLAWQWDFLSSALNLGPKSSLNQVVMLGHSYLLNGWEEFYMHTALQSVPLVTREAVDASSVSYWDQSALKNDAKQFVCFEQAFSTRETSNYYFDRSEAEVFRSQARRALGVRDDVEEDVPCSPRDFKVLFLQRPPPLPRPMWNADKLLQELRGAGFRNIKLSSISDNTPFFQQAMLFREADLVVSVHGSQLCNLVYMRDQTYIIEIFPHKYYSNQPLTLSTVLGRATSHFQLRSNPLPSVELVRERDKSFVDLATRCQELDTQYDDWETCILDRDCRWVFS
ncbi:hypothetical protein ACM66B_003323 [Microbotryomycetes sp. NB124-2]